MVLGRGTGACRCFPKPRRGPAQEGGRSSTSARAQLKSLGTHPQVPHQQGYREDVGRDCLLSQPWGWVRSGRQEGLCQQLAVRSQFLSPGLPPTCGPAEAMGVGRGGHHGDPRISQDRGSWLCPGPRNERKGLPMRASPPPPSPCGGPAASCGEGPRPGWWRHLRGPPAPSLPGDLWDIVANCQQVPFRHFSPSGPSPFSSGAEVHSGPPNRWPQATPNPRPPREALRVPSAGQGRPG